MLQSHHGQFSYFFLILARPQPNLLRKQLLIKKSVVLLTQKISGGGTITCVTNAGSFQCMGWMNYGFSFYKNEVIKRKGWKCPKN